jgi:hypothetical protein
VWFVKNLRGGETFKQADVMRLASISHEVDKLLGMILNETPKQDIKIQARIIKTAINK